MPVEGLRKDSLHDVCYTKALQPDIVEKTGIKDYHWSTLTPAQ